MTRKDQQVGDGATGIQAEGNVTIQTGLSVAELDQIVTKVASALLAQHSSERSDGAADSHATDREKLFQTAIDATREAFMLLKGKLREMRRMLTEGKLSAESVALVFELAAQLHEEIKYSLAFQDQRRLLPDIGVVNDFINLGVARHEPRWQSAFSFYLLAKRSSALPLEILPPQMAEIRELIVYQIHFVGAEFSRLNPLRRIRSLLTGKHSIDVWSGPSPAPCSTELQETVHTAFHRVFERQLGLRSASADFRLANSIAFVCQNNVDDRPEVKVASIITNSSRFNLCEIDQFRNVVRSLLPAAHASRLKDVPLVQHVYAPAWTSYCIHIGAALDLESFSKLCLDVRETSFRLRDLVWQDGEAALSSRSYQLRELQRSVRDFIDLIEPFHDHVANVVELEGDERVMELETLAKKITQGAATLNDIIKMNVDWLDDDAQNHAI